MTVIRQCTLRRAEAIKWLDLHGDIAPPVSVYLKAGSTRADAEKSLLPVLDRSELFDELSEKAAKSPTGAAIFCGMAKSIVLWPPFPLKESKVEKGYEPGVLKAMLEWDWRIGLVLVRLGHYAIAAYQGETLLEHKAGTGLVHARHRKGGSSANRFARHRGKQIESFFTRVEIHAREILEPHLRELDYVFYGGTRDTMLSLWRQCDFFRKLEAKASPRLLNVREPKYSELQEALEQTYSSVIYEFGE